MSASVHPWEAIYRNEGRIYNEPFPGFAEVVQDFKVRGSLKILDLGCGNGRHVVQLAQRGFTVCGLDISLTALGLTRDWLSEERLHSDTVQADMRFPLPLGDGSFSGVLSTQVIHHARISEVRQTISEILRVLVPGGVAFVTVSGHKDEGEEFEEIEPGTFVPLTGPEKGLLHHIFTIEEAGFEFRRFNIEQVSKRAEGKVIALLVSKPLGNA